MDLAKELNDALFEIADDPDCKCTRIAFKGGRINGTERDLGGMCKKSLEAWFREELDRRGFETGGPTEHDKGRD